MSGKPYKDTPIMGYPQKQIKEEGKWQTICQKCKYKDSPFMPCNACDDLGSQFKSGADMRGDTDAVN